MLKTSIIQRRELDPLWNKAKIMAQYYEKATNCISAVMGADSIEVEYSKNPKNNIFCMLCKRYSECAEKLEAYEIPCSALHRGMAVKAGKLGGMSVYTCPVGLFFWTSPFFSGERFAGALMAGGILSVEKQQAIDRIYNICKGDVSLAEISRHFDGIPEKSLGEVEAIAGIMRLCAGKISSEGDEQAVEGCKFSNVRLQDYSDMERRLFACLRRGDNTEACNIIRGILNGIDTVCGGSVKFVKLKAVELAALLSRAGASSDNCKELFRINNRYLKRIDDSKTTEDVCENLCLLARMMAGEIFSFQGIRHAAALRKAERFIWENYSRKLSLKEVAGASGLSAPYFSTVFRDEMGENFLNYLNRIRVEKASEMLKETELPFCEISAACGFDDNAWFSKIFKNYTGISPCKYRESGGIINQ